ncbi:MAG: hypothetical protein Q8P48_01465 [Deltaproteobacteria bacterium]|nr:hypothetical protein [Deltaproteobacteria bacterium]
MDRRSQEELKLRDAAPVSIYRALRLLALPASVLVIGLGYFFIWSVSPDTPLEEVVGKTRLGVIFAVLGAALLALWLHRSSK